MIRESGTNLSVGSSFLIETLSLPALARKMSVPLVSANERPARCLLQDRRPRRLSSETTETVIFRFSSLVTGHLAHVLIGYWALDVERSAFASPSSPSLNNQLSTLSRQRLDPLPFLRAELEFGRTHVLLKMRERRCARDCAALVVFSYSALA